jgi:hypothetical protein
VCVTIKKLNLIKACEMRNFHEMEGVVAVLQCVVMRRSRRIFLIKLDAAQCELCTAVLGFGAIFAFNLFDLLSLINLHNSFDDDDDDDDDERKT